MGTDGNGERAGRRGSVIERAARSGADGDGERAGWGDVDDETLALYAAGTCSPEERTRVESVMLRYPDVREIVEDIRQRGFFIP